MRYNYFDSIISNCKQAKYNFENNRDLFVRIG